MHDPQGTKLGYIWLKPGVSRLNGYTLLYVMFVSIGLLVFLNFQQPYVLEVMLDIPKDQHGRVVAQMALIHEIVLISLVGPAGALADRIGRRKVLAVGYVVLAAGYMAYPFATSVTMLTVFRGVFAAGAAAVISTFTTVLTDYPQEQSRGKLVALGSILNGVGLTLLAGLGGQVISMLTASGYDPVVSGRMAITGVGMIGFFSAIVVMFGLRGESLRIKHERIPLTQLMREGFIAGKKPRIALAYVSALVSRGDNVVIGMYLSLWAQQAGMAAGLSAGDAQGKAGIMVAIVSGSPILFAAFFGIMNDRLNRLTFLIISLAIAVVGYTAFGSLSYPIMGVAVPVGIVMGCGQVAGIIASQTLIGQEADPRIAGSTLGAFNFFGALGTMISGVLGGYLYDKWTPGGPFLMMGIASFLLMVACIVVRLREPKV